MKKLAEDEFGNLTDLFGDMDEDSFKNTLFKKKSWKVQDPSLAADFEPQIEEKDNQNEESGEDELIEEPDKRNSSEKANRKLGRNVAKMNNLITKLLNEHFE